ncbi:MAG: hypothetical protein ACFFC7_23005 [Candidatus Hermodarchaeota archaeon]
MEDVKKISVVCRECQKKEDINITQSHIGSTVGGLFRVAVIHQCKNTSEDQVLVVFLDKNLYVRDQTLAPLSTAPLEKDTTGVSLAALTGLTDPEELSKVLFNVFVGDPVVVIGNREGVEIVVQTLALFSPFVPKIVLWQEKPPSKPIKGSQIIGLNSADPKNKEFRQALILDLFTGKTLGKAPVDPFCLKIAHDIRSLEKGGAIIIESIVEELLQRATSQASDNPRKIPVPKDQRTLVKKMVEKIRT